MDTDAALCLLEVSKIKSFQLWIRGLKVILVQHVATHYQPSLDDFLKDNVACLLAVYHPFSYCVEKRSRALLFKSTKTIRCIRSVPIKGPEMLHFLKDVVFTLIVIARVGGKFDLYIGANCLNTMLGLFLRTFGFVKTVIYWSVDYVPFRFNNPLANAVYHAIDRISALSADFVWNYSYKMAMLRRVQGVPPTRNMVTPQGFNPREVPVLRSEPVASKTLVYTGGKLHVDTPEATELILLSLPYIVKKVPDVMLYIIGTCEGSQYSKWVRRVIRSLGMGRHVTVLEKLPRRKLMGFLSKCRIGLGIYVPGSFSGFGGAMKCKEYIACGLPIIITKVPEMAFEIERTEAGIAINYDRKELAEAAVKLLEDNEFYVRCRKNAITLSLKYNWDHIFSNTMEKIYHQLRG